MEREEKFPCARWLFLNWAYRIEEEGGGIFSRIGFGEKETGKCELWAFGRKEKKRNGIGPPVISTCFSDENTTGKKLCEHEGNGNSKEMIMEISTPGRGR